MKTRFQFLALILFTVFNIQAIQASKIKLGDQIIIDQPVEENLYLAGKDITIKTKLSKDVIGAGGTILILDSIAQDLLCAGGDINISGVVGGDVRVFGGKIKIFNHIYGDLVIAGGDALIYEDVIVFGDLLVAGGTVNFKGIVKGKSNLNGGDISFSGVAEGPIEVDGSKFEAMGNFNSAAIIGVNKLVLDPGAKFSGAVRYYQKDGEIDFGPTLLEGASAEFDPTLKPKFSIATPNNYKGVRLYFLIFKVLSASLLIVIAVSLFNRFFTDASENVKGRAINNLAVGFLYFFAVPFLILLTCVTVIGIPIGLLIAALFGISVALAHIVTSVLSIYVLEDYIHQTWSKWEIIFMSIGVFFLLKLIAYIPFAGAIINAIMVMIAFGTIIYAIRQNIHKGRNNDLDHSPELTSMESY
jgi:hypothetical protein